MRRACLVTVMCWLLPTAAFAAPCLPGSLGSYVALGGGGCSIGTAQFFNFLSLPVQPGAAPIPDSNVLVNPLFASISPGFRFDVNSQAQPGAGDFFDLRLGYSLLGPGFTGSQLTLNGSNVTGDGGNNAAENVCLGAAFGAGQFCSSLNTTGLGVYDGPLLGQLLLDSRTFGSTTLLGVIVDISVDGGAFGAANLASVTTQFTPAPQAAPIPEPATLTLLALGLAAVIGRQRLRNRKSPQT